MHEFPHLYRVGARVVPDAPDVVLRSDGLPEIVTAPPVEFDGPGDRWSPETLLVGAVCDCFVLGFKSIASASRLEWLTLDVRVEGKLERIDKRTRFTEISIAAELTVPSGAENRAPRLLEKAEEICLITNSLSARVQFAGNVVVG